MSTIEERLARLEVRDDAVRNDVAHVREVVMETESDLKGLVAALESRMDRRFDVMERRFDAMDARFQWVIGLQFAVLLAIVAAAFAVITQLL